MSDGGARGAGAVDALGRAWRTMTRRLALLGPEQGDAVLYGLSALFAAGVAVMANASTAAYRQWAEIAVGPYVVAAVASIVWSRRRTRATDTKTPGGLHVGPARVWLLLFLLLGATVVPLCVEVGLRQGTASTAHVQPEVVVIDQAAVRLADGKDPYHATVVDGHVHSAVPGEPSFESFFPYLPLMAVFGLPSSTHAPVKVTDTRLVFSVVTLLLVGLSLAALRAPPERTLRVLQVLTVLPSAALPLATGGDDMPVVAFLLLALVLAQRRRPGWSGIVLGVVSAMKFTAWPLALLALFAARDRSGRRTPARMALGLVAVAGPICAPFAFHDARAFVDNVILFPLGLSGVTSPAASNLPGHLLVTALPWLHRALPVAVAVLGGAVLVRRLVRRPPSSAGQVATIGAWVMLVAILFAPATRVGYLLYPLNFFVWGWALRAAEEPSPAPVGHRSLTVA